ncbi:MAG TPA: hypothetical protein VKY92_05415 [Verrucomicrobiae bacterium]|jgi:hypothetical protein|nr:hypothetical protein [Verrucomicrobiae bacterium]
MYIQLVLVAMMALLYGLAWHNEPARSQGQKPTQDKNNSNE